MRLTTAILTFAVSVLTGQLAHGLDTESVLESNQLSGLDFLSKAQDSVVHRNLEMYTAGSEVSWLLRMIIISWPAR
jgi:hypothetical protein